LKYYIIAGEASGDLHGSNLIKALKVKDAQAQIQAWGGELMEQAGATIIKHYKHLAFMGFIEVIANLKTILNNIKFAKNNILNFKPDVLILIDYPGFNLRIAKWAKANNIKVIYYISPQVWAWKENRVKQIKQNVHKMLCILPFEKAFYQKWQYDVDYVGHPLIQVINNFKQANANQSALFNKPLIALLPGSRKQEILKMLPIMLQMANKFEAYQFAVAQAPGLSQSFYEPLLSQYSNVSLLNQKTYFLLMQAKAALVTSGTATLETALFKVPQIVCYKGNGLSYQIAKWLIKIKYISLVNLIEDKPIVKELIQNQLNSSNLEQELNQLLNNETYTNQMQHNYQNLYQNLYTTTNASEVAAAIIYNDVMGH
jgi:lipid-A-disaccharide synthase